MKIRPLKIAPNYGPLEGVCAGMGYALDIPPPIIRLIFIFLIFAGGLGLVIYFVLLFILPEWKPLPNDFLEITGENERVDS